MALLNNIRLPVMEDYVTAKNQRMVLFFRWVFGRWEGVIGPPSEEPFV